MMTPVIRATFKLNEKGEPDVVEQNDLKHYWIRLQMENLPEDTYAVTYLLDETYYDPVHESRDQASYFPTELTSYGDYTLQAKVRTRERVETVATPLSVALKRSYLDNPTPQIEAALRDIREN
jgi:hypothetical protein